MSLKPVKKSDAKKSWLSKRVRNTRKIQPEHHLIATEGICTEPAYFQAIKNVINSKYRNKIQLEILGVGRNTISLLNRAKRYVENNCNVFKHVWIIYDIDDFPEENVNSVVDLCKSFSNQETTYHAIWSNQCIELWFLLHFAYIQTDIDRNEYCVKLSNYLLALDNGEYRKNRQDIYDILQPYMKSAIKHAKKLAKMNKNKTAYNSRPGTEVYRLVEKLLPYLL